MKIFARLSIAILVVGLMVGLSGFTSGENNAAGVNEGFGCGLFDGYGHLAVSYESIAVTNNGGNTMLTCHATGVPTPGVVYKNSGFPCYIFGSTTDNSWAVVDTEGNAMLKCMIKKPTN